MNDNGDSQGNFKENFKDYKKSSKNTTQSASDFEDARMETSYELTGKERDDILSKSTDVAFKGLDINDKISELSSYVEQISSAFEEQLKSKSRNSNSINRRASISSSPKTRSSKDRSLDYNTVSSLNFPNVPYDTPRSRSRSSSLDSSISGLSSSPDAPNALFYIMPAMSDINVRLDNLNSEVESLGNSVALLAKALNERNNTGFSHKVKDSFDKVINNMKKPFVALGEYYDAMKETLSNGVEKVGDFFKDVKNKFLDSLKKCKNAVNNSVNSALESTGKVLMFPVKKIQQMNRSIKDLASSVNTKIENFADEVRISALERKKSLLVGGSKIEDVLNPGKTYDRAVNTLLNSENAAKKERSEDNSDSRKISRSIRSKVDKIDQFKELQGVLEKNMSTAEKRVSECRLLLGNTETRGEWKKAHKDLKHASKNLEECKRVLDKCTSHLDRIKGTVISYDSIEKEISNIRTRIEDRKNGLTNRIDDNNLKERSQSKNVPQRDRTQSLSEESPKFHKITLQRSSSESDITTDKAVKRQAPQPPISSQKPESDITTDKAVKRQAPQPPISSQKPESDITTDKAVKRQAPQPPIENNNKSEVVKGSLLDRIMEAKKGLKGVKAASNEDSIKGQASSASPKNLRSIQRG